MKVGAKFGRHTITSDNYRLPLVIFFLEPCELFTWCLFNNHSNWSLRYGHNFVCRLKTIDQFFDFFSTWMFSPSTRSCKFVLLSLFGTRLYCYLLCLYIGDQFAVRVFQTIRKPIIFCIDRYSDSTFLFILKIQLAIHRVYRIPLDWLKAYANIFDIIILWRAMINDWLSEHSWGA